MRSMHQLLCEWESSQVSPEQDELFSGLLSPFCETGSETSSLEVQCGSCGSDAASVVSDGSGQSEILCEIPIE